MALSILRWVNKLSAAKRKRSKIDARPLRRSLSSSREIHCGILQAMHIFFLDESGTPPHPTKLRDKYFVVGGIVIPDGVWGMVRDSLQGMKVRRRISGELKWRYFASANDDPQNPMREMDQVQRNEIRAEIYQIICGTKSIKAMACVCCIEV